MKFKNKIDTRYLDLKRRSKIREQLEIGKIKFEVIPIYLNKICVYSLFKPKYNALEPTNLPNNKKTLVLIKILFIFLIGFLIFNNFHYLLLSLGIMTQSNDLIIATVTPYIFQNITYSLIPHLSILLSKLTLL